jgi:hypothetical protein
MDTYRNIPFFNYSALFKAREEEIMEVLHDVLARGAYILQKDLQEFEQKLRGRRGRHKTHTDILAERPRLNSPTVPVK